MTLARRMRGWALRRRDAAIERVEAARRASNVPALSHGERDRANDRVDRAMLRLEFWDALYVRLSPTTDDGHPRPRP